ncbi:hypothetical protein MH17539M_06810 [Enterobacter hormaechei]|nr:hypothetical protein MH17539M_06810 [Enterobacter hormaechei]
MKSAKNPDSPEVYPRARKALASIRKISIASDGTKKLSACSVGDILDIVWRNGSKLNAKITRNSGNNIATG